MITGRINAGVVTSSHDLFLTCRGGRMYTLLYNNIQRTVHVGFSNAKKSLT
jgi:hypothetical protein